MAYYNPYQTYNPYTVTTPPSSSTSVPQMPSSSMTVPQMQTSSLMAIFVDNFTEVNDYPVAAGNTVLLISFKLGKFYLKSTGTNGVPQPIRVFGFTEEENKIGYDSDSVSRAEFNALKDKLSKLLKELGGDS